MNVDTNPITPRSSHYTHSREELRDSAPHAYALAKMPAYQCCFHHVIQVMEDHGRWWNFGPIPARMSFVGESPLQGVVLDELADHLDRTYEKQLDGAICQRP